MRIISLKPNFVSFPHLYPAQALARLNWPAALTGLGLLGLFVALFTAIQFATPHLVGSDGYYHIKLAQLMREQGLRPPFPWLPLTVLKPEAYVDHHFLYHLLLIPFTYGDLAAGAKWASILFPALTFLSGWLLLRSQKTPYAALWSIALFATSEGFLYRMSMPRTQSLSLMVLLLALHLILTRRYHWLLPLAFLYVWLYNAFPLILLPAGFYTAARWLLERRLSWAPLIYTGLGLGLGLLINPYFPDNLLFIYHHLSPKLNDATATPVGIEWYPYTTWSLIDHAGPALLLFIAGVVALGLSERRMDTATAASLFISLLFGLMLFKSRRFVEYYPAFALIFCALAWTPLLRSWLGRANRLRWALPAALLLILVPAVWFNLQAAQASVQRAKPSQRYGQAAAWLQANTPAGSRVFQTDWDDFPRLFFHNTHNTYTLGLDPTYMELYDADLYRLWVKLTRGQVEQPAQVIIENFAATYILSDLDHKAFLRQAKADPQIVELYRDEEAVIFKIITQEEVDQLKQS